MSGCGSAPSRDLRLTNLVLCNGGVAPRFTIGDLQAGTIRGTIVDGVPVSNIVDFGDIFAEDIVANRITALEQLTIPTGDITNITPGPPGSIFYDESTGDIYVSNGDTWNLSSGGGLPLNFYDEEHFVPLVGGSGDFGSAGYTEQRGTYTRIGRTVNFHICVNAASFLIDGMHPSPSGELIVRGLPLQNSTVANSDTVVSLAIKTLEVPSIPGQRYQTSEAPNPTPNEFIQNLQAIIPAGSSDIYIQKKNIVNASRVVNPDGITSAHLYLSGSYTAEGFSFEEDGAPDTIITSSPPANTASTDATFVWEGIGDFDYFEYKLDGGAWVQTTNTTETFSGLVSGISHTFEVRAVSTTLGMDGTPATRTWIIGGTPDTVITPTPPIVTNQTSLTVNYQAVGPVTSFETRYQVDGGGYSPWTSQGLNMSQTISGLLPGSSYDFQVRAVFNAFVDPTPAVASWTVDVTAPVTVITNPIPAVFTVNRGTEFIYNFQAVNGSVIDPDIQEFQVFWRVNDPSAPPAATYPASGGWVAYAPTTPTSGQGIWNTTQAPASIPDLSVAANPTNYYFYVFAVDLAGNVGPYASHQLIKDFTIPSSEYILCPDMQTQPIDHVNFEGANGFQAQYVPGDQAASQVPTATPTFFLSVDGGPQINLNTDGPVYPNIMIQNVVIAQDPLSTPIANQWTCTFDMKMTVGTSTDPLNGSTVGTAYFENGEHDVQIRVVDNDTGKQQPNTQFTSCLFTIECVAAFRNIFMWGKFDSFQTSGATYTDPYNSTTFDGSGNVLTFQDATGINPAVYNYVQGGGSPMQAGVATNNGRTSIDFTTTDPADVYTMTTTRTLSGRFNTMLFLFKESPSVDTPGLFFDGSRSGGTGGANGSSGNGGFSSSGNTQGTSLTYMWNPSVQSIDRGGGQTGFYANGTGAERSTIPATDPNYVLPRDVGAPKGLSRPNEYCVLAVRGGGDDGRYTSATGGVPRVRFDMFVNGYRDPGSADVYPLLASTQVCRSYDYRTATNNVNPRRQLEEMVVFAGVLSDEEITEIYRIWEARLATANPGDVFPRYTRVIHDTFTGTGVQVPVQNHQPEQPTTVTPWVQHDVQPVGGAAMASNLAVRSSQDLISVTGGDRTVASEVDTPVNSAFIDLGLPVANRVFSVGISLYLATPANANFLGRDGVGIRRVPVGATQDQGSYWYVGNGANSTAAGSSGGARVSLMRVSNPNPTPNAADDVFTTLATNTAVFANVNTSSNGGLNYEWARVYELGATIFNDVSDVNGSAYVRGTATHCGAYSNLNPVGNESFNTVSALDTNVGFATIYTEGTQYGVALTLPNSRWQEFSTYVL